MKKQQALAIFEELLADYREAKSAVISEMSSDIATDVAELDEDIGLYRSRFSEALGVKPRPNKTTPDLLSALCDAKNIITAILANNRGLGTIDRVCEIYADELAAIDSAIRESTNRDAGCKLQRLCDSVDHNDEFGCSSPLCRKRPA